jgi:nitroimidazol reductase NimA-like FMN-containing flavoprotein (pyridoxamine 5'-phosphate oxidase superfamily)
MRSVRTTIASLSVGCGKASGVDTPECAGNGNLRELPSTSRHSMVGRQNLPTAPKAISLSSRTPSDSQPGSPIPFGEAQSLRYYPGAAAQPAGQAARPHRGGQQRCAYGQEVQLPGRRERRGRIRVDHPVRGDHHVVGRQLARQLSVLIDGGLAGGVLDADPATPNAAKARPDPRRRRLPGPLTAVCRPHVVHCGVAGAHAAGEPLDSATWSDRLATHGNTLSSATVTDALADRCAQPPDVPGSVMGELPGDEDRWQELAKSECFALLAGAPLGRIAIVDDQGPAIFPVNFILDSHMVVFRTDEGSKLDAACRGRRVAFEIDGIDSATRTGWSVLVRGEAVEVTNPAEVQRLAEITPEPWAPGAKAHFVRILPTGVTGRQILARGGQPEQPGSGPVG